MGNFQKYWWQNVGQDFIVLDFFVGGYRAGGKGVCGRVMSPAHEDGNTPDIIWIFLGISFGYLDTSRCYHTRDNMDFLGISFGY
jgi:hypothetical protein